MGCPPLLTFTDIGSILSLPISLEHVAELKRDQFYGGLPKRLKAMVAYLKVGPQVRTYSDYLRAAREAEKEDSIELPPEPKGSSNGWPLQAEGN